MTLNLDSHTSEIQTVIDKYKLTLSGWDYETGQRFKSRFCRDLSADEWSEMIYCIYMLLKNKSCE